MATTKKALTDEEMAELRAKQAEAQAKKTPNQEFLAYFPDYEDNKTALRKLADDIRLFRKNKLKEGVDHVDLPQGLKAPFYLALDRLDYDTYRPEIGTLLIEGLKIQDREIKIASYHYLDNLFTKIGQVDFGWISQMLARRYVSRYGWMLMRKHAKSGSHLLLFGGAILGDLLDEWAKDSKTQKDWERLSQEDGKPADMREVLPRRK
jgi:hypothetical protein